MIYMAMTKLESRKKTMRKKVLTVKNVSRRGEQNK